jgi:hypothetical protein
MIWPTGFSIPNPTPCLGGPWNQTSSHVTISKNGINIPGPWTLSGCGWGGGVQISFSPTVTPAGSNLVVVVTGVTNGSNPGGTTFNWKTSQGSGTTIQNFSAQPSLNNGTVNTPPTITSIANQTGCGTFGPLSFTIGDAETSAANLTLSAVASNPTLFPSSGITFGGSGANRTISLVAASAQSGSSDITITVTDDDGDMVTSSFLATVNPLPTVTNGTTQVVNYGDVVAEVSTAGNMGSGATYAWTNSNTSIGLAAFGTGNVPQFIATNTTGFIQTQNVNRFF